MAILRWTDVGPMLTNPRPHFHQLPTWAQHFLAIWELLQQVYRYHILRKTFSKFHHRHYELIYKFNVALNKNKTDPLRAVGVLVRKEMGHTVVSAT